MVDESQSLVGTHPHLATWRLDQGIDSVGRQGLRRGIIPDLMLLTIIEIQTSSIGGYPDMPSILKDHRIDEEITIGSWKFRRIEESTDTMASLVDAITSMGGTHRNTLLVWRLHDTLYLIDRQIDNRVIHTFVFLQGRWNMHQVAIQATDPQASLTILEYTIHIVGLQLAIRYGIGSAAAPIGMNLIDAIAIGTHQDLAIGSLAKGKRHLIK